MPLQVKICGLTNSADAHVAAEAGAAMLGFVFFPSSPRNLSLQEAKNLGKSLPEGPDRVGVFVNPDNAFLDNAIRTLSLDWVQLHGTESPERVHEIQAGFNVGIIKALSISTEKDLTAIKAYTPFVDAFLFDAKPEKDSALPGGNGLSFDWSLLKNYPMEKPWLLAGGLSLKNLEKAIEQSGAEAVDLSSSLEKTAGKKDPALIKAFLQAASML